MTDFERCAAYSDRHKAQALVIVRDGKIVFERFVDGFDASTPHALYSGTKSFWGPLSIVARGEGLLSLDETVGETVPTWSEGVRAGVTLRQLLALTSGIGFGGLGNAVPVYARALAVELKNVPGSTFTYGGIPLQVFGAVLAEKLRPLGLTPHEYLRARLLDPIGCVVARWRSLADGTQPLPTGAFLSATAWAAYGAFVADGGLPLDKNILTPSELGECFVGSGANGRYGLGWWLSPIGNRPDIVYASGSGGQAMYVVRADRTVIVRFAAGGSFKHETFLKAYLAGRTS